MVASIDESQDVIHEADIAMFHNLRYENTHDRPFVRCLDIFYSARLLSLHFRVNHCRRSLTNE